MKTKYFLTALMIILSSAFTNHSNAQWTKANGPHGGFSKGMFADGNDVYACNNILPFGIYKSTDNGAIWRRHSNYASDIRTFAKIGSTFFCGSWEGAAAKSTDGGVSWTIISSGLGNFTVNALAVIGTTLYAGTLWTGGTNGGVYMTTNNGTNWTHTGLATNIYSLLVQGSNLFAGTDNQGVYLSTNGGTNWTQVNTGLPLNRVVTLANVGSTIFAGIEDFSGKVYRTTNNGTSWTAVNTGLPAGVPTVITAKGNDLYVGMRVPFSGMYKSTNLGNSWSAVNNGIPNFALVQSMVSNSNALISSIEIGTAVGTVTIGIGGLWRTTNDGTNWSQTGLAERDVRAFASLGANLFAGVSSGNQTLGAVYVSSNNGADWQLTSLRQPTLALAVSGSDIYAGVTGGVYKTTNNGANWTQVFAIGSATYGLFVLGGNIYAANLSGGIYLSTNNGANWTNIGLSGNGNSSVVVSGTSLFAGSLTPANGIKRSTNGGASWVNVFTGLINSMAVNGTDIYACTNGGIRKSTNNGDNWVNIGVAANTYSIIFSGNNIFAGLDLAGVYVSTNNGSSWNPFNTGFTGGVTALTISGGQIIAGTLQNSVWRRPLSETGVQIVSNEVPSGFSLSQNYPNPFNPSTTINFSIAKAGHTSLHVYDLLGREVAALVNEFLATGTYEVRWDGKTAQGSPAGTGIYFYRLQAGSFVESKKMILLK